MRLQVSEAYRTALTRREVLRKALLAAMDAQQLDVLVYPPIRRRAARLGDVQGGGNNCQLSASTGLPALVMPAGFTPDGFPVGIEFLGRAFEEPRLLRIGATLERLAPMRRAPASTPPLAASARLVSTSSAPATPPASAAGGTVEVKASFAWDAAARILTFDVAVSGVPPSDVILVALHRGEANQSGPVIAPLVRTGAVSARGSITLRDSERDDLLAGQLYVRWYTRSAPLGDGRIPVWVR